MVPGKNIFKKESYLAGTDLDRLQDLTEAVLDPKIEAIICIRGGYGSGRLLPQIPFSSFRRNPKLFIGHSDITFLHLGLMSKAGWTTFHGPNLTGMSEAPQKAESVLKVLSGEASYEWRLDPRADHQARRRRRPRAGGKPELPCPPAWNTLYARYDRRAAPDRRLWRSPLPARPDDESPQAGRQYCPCLAQSCLENLPAAPKTMMYAGW